MIQLFNVTQHLRVFFANYQIVLDEECIYLLIEWFRKSFSYLKIWVALVFQISYSRLKNIL